MSESHMFSSEFVESQEDKKSAFHDSEIGDQPGKLQEPAALSSDVEESVDKFEDNELGIQPGVLMVPGSDCFSDDSYASEDWVVMPNGERVLDEVKRSARRSARSARRSARGAKPQGPTIQTEPAKEDSPVAVAAPEEPKIVPNETQ